MADRQLPWPKPYEQLAQALYALRRRFASPLLLGASVVHPRHSIPPEHLVLLKAIEAQEPVRAPSIGTIVFRWIICLSSAAFDTVFLLALTIRHAFSPRGPKAADVIMKTWVPGPAALKNGTDFYYGNLFALLQRRGLRPLLLVGDGRSDDGRLVSKLKLARANWQFVGAAISDPSRRFYPEALLIPLSVSLLAAVSQLVLAFRLRRFAKRETDFVLRQAAAHACLDVLRPYTTKNVTHFHVARRAVRAWKPAAVVTFYEGQPWEKLFWLGAKRANPDVSVVGYQHTVVMPHSLALVKPEKIQGEIATPDVVLCTGEVTKEILGRALEPFQSRVCVLGSHRRAADDPPPQPPRPGRKTVLVLPEGILSEAILIFNTILDIAPRLPDHHFILRCHPVLPFEKVQPHLKDLVSRHQNIELSKNPAIQADFQRSSTLIYRGSSAVLYAVLSGVKPFCLVDRTAPNVDPLSLLPAWRSYAENDADLVKKIAAFAGASTETVEPEWREAARYVQAVVQPVREEAIEKIVAEMLS